MEKKKNNNTEKDTKSIGGLLFNSSYCIILLLFQLMFIIFLAVFGRFKNHELEDEETNSMSRMYPMFMDVHTMMFIGFGFLMAFLKRYGYSALGFNFIVAAFVLEWSLIIEGWIEMIIEKEDHFNITLTNLLISDFSAAAVLISFGAVIGKLSLSQLLVMAFVEVVFQRFNEYFGITHLVAHDIGESIFVHVFGAYFGLVVAKIACKRVDENPNEGASYQSDMLAMIGTIFLWLFWPSFNAATAESEGQLRAIVNTYTAITASCVVTFLVSGFLEHGRLDMVHIQNATLAGGVAVGAVADVLTHPVAAVLIGSFAGLVSCFGYRFLSPWLKSSKYFYLHDTCGVNNLHGMPGIISGIVSAIVAASSSRDNLSGNRLYKFYPALVPKANSTEYFQYELDELDEFASGGLGRSPAAQGAIQFAALLITLGMAMVGGCIAGLLIRLPLLNKVEDESVFLDEPYWVLPMHDEEKPVQEKPEKVAAKSNRASQMPNETVNGNESGEQSTQDLPNPV